MNNNLTADYEVPTWIGEYKVCSDDGGAEEPIITVLDDEYSSLDVYGPDFRVEFSVWQGRPMRSLDDAKRCAAELNRLVARWEELERNRP